MGKTTRFAAKKFACDRNFIEVEHMDTEAQPIPTHEIGGKIEESSSDPPGEVTNLKDDVSKIPRITRQTRSRSQTPQKSKEKNDDNLKSKKTELKVIVETSNNADHSMNGHGEKDSDNSKAKDKNEQKDEKPKKDNAKKSKNADTKDNKKEVSNEASKKVDNLNKNVDNKDTSNLEKNRVSPRSHTKKENSKQSISKDNIRKPGTKETSTVESEISSKNKNLSKPEGEGVEMDPLILATDEPDPELQFDENSDLESGKGSPIQLRCKTRRSHTRNIPTPKTPKSTDSESEKNSVALTPTPENLNDTNDSLNIEDISTRAEVGGDVTRLDYIAHDSTFASGDNSYLNYSRDRSLGETLRCLSPRKTIRPINDAYRQRAFRNNHNKSELNMLYPEQDSVDRIAGIKRKRSSTPEERKKFKADSVGFISYLSSPLNNLKNKFITDASSSTPKLTGYKDSRENIHEDLSYTEVVSEIPEKKNWCAIM